MKNLCGWSSSQAYKSEANISINLSYSQARPNYQSITPFKLSVKSPQIARQSQISITVEPHRIPYSPEPIQQPTQIITQSMHSFQKVNQTQITNVGSMTQPQKVSTETLPNYSLRSSLIDQISQSNIKSEQQNYQHPHTSRAGYSLFSKPIKNIHESQNSNQNLKFSTHPKMYQSVSNTFKMQNINYQQNQPILVQSYSQLLKQNMELKKIINNQFKPMKQMYEKLKQQHNDRQFLISQLQWKVKQLAMEMKNKKI